MRDAQWFDKWCRRAKTKPVVRIHDAGGDILVGDSGEPIRDGKKVFYRTCYAVERDGVQVGAFEDYNDITRFFQMGPRLGQETRVNEAIAAARQFKADLRAVNYWDWAHGKA